METDQHQVNIRLGADLNYINPLLSGNAYARQVEQLIYLPMCQHDPEDLKLKPVLAKSLPIIKELEGQRVKYNFEIKSEAIWSDGEPLTGKDYLFTFKTIYNPELKTDAYRTYLSFIDSIVLDKFNDRKLTVYANRKYHLAETILSSIDLFPEHILDPQRNLRKYSLSELRTVEKGNAEFVELGEKFKKLGQTGTTELVGSGPYYLEEWQEKEFIRLKRKKDYWGNNHSDQCAYLSSSASILNFKIIPNEGASFQALKSGDIDVMNETSAIHYQEIIADQYPDLRGLESPQFLYYYIALNRDRYPLSTAELRRALAQSWNNNEWISNQLFGLAKPIIGPVSFMKDYYHADLPLIEYEPAKATEIFKTAGYDLLDAEGYLVRQIDEKTERLSLNLAFSVGNQSAHNLATYFSQLAKKSGLEIISEPMDFARLRQVYKSGQYDMIFLASSAPPSDYDPRQRWHTDSWGAGNKVRFGDARSDAIIDSISETLDASKRALAYREFQEAIYQDTPCVFLYSPFQLIAANKEIQLKPSKLWPGYIIQELNRKQRRN